jgi:hypothetical protein
MKYFVLSIVFILFLSYSLSAQKFNGGILLGMSASQVDGDTYSGYRKAGLIGGAFVNRYLNDNFSWQLELKFIQKGSHHIPDSLDFTDRVYRLQLNYAEVPLSINYHYKKKFILNLGIGMGYLFSFKEESDDVRLYEDADRYFNDYELSYNFGITYKLSKKLLFNFSHSYSILPIRRHASGSVWRFNRGQYNNLLAFTFYYQFNNEGK